MIKFSKILLISIFAIAVVFLGVQVSNASEYFTTSDNYIEPEIENEVNTTISVDFIETGKMVASWYGPKFHGKQTANTEIYNQQAFTAAHKSLPFGTMLRITNPNNNNSVIVRINDRGPYISGRDIDLSKGAAKALGMIEKGVIKVQVETIIPRYSSL